MKRIAFLGWMLCGAGMIYAEPPGVGAASSSTTVSAEIVEGIALLQTPATSALEARIARERATRLAGIMVLPYKPNYFLPYTNNSNMNQLASTSLGDAPYKEIEAKFQISLRMPVIRGMFWNHGILQFAYTQVSFWQVYNKDISAAFRETNYEPEMTLNFETRWNVLGLTTRFFNLGVVHQSNGQTSTLSRSWNRVTGEAIVDRGGFAASFKPWYLLHDSYTDNPDIRRYMGDFELLLTYKLWEQVFSVMLRNNLYLEGNNKGAVQATYSFPVFKLLRGYAQYFNGYGESLIDYNHPSSRFGVGLAFSDWL